MTDIITHLFDAPIANLLVVAGIAFLGVAVLGNIANKIAPGKVGRILAGLVGTVLIIGGILMHSTSDSHPGAPGQSANPQTAAVPASRSVAPQETSGPAPNALAGMWVNQDNVGKNGVHKFQVQQDGNRTLVHGWGLCSPQDCDWGVQPATTSGDVTTVTFQTGEVVREFTLNLDPSGAVHASVKVTHIGKPTKTAEHTFQRAR